MFPMQEYGMPSYPTLYLRFHCTDTVKQRNKSEMTWNWKDIKTSFAFGK